MIKQLLAAFAITFLPLTVSAQSSCPNHFAGGMEPVVTNQKMLPKYHELCNSEYAVGYSGLTRTPLWSAGVLTREGLKTKGRLVRRNEFSPDSRIPFSERAELGDYSRSGYDRGHMSPAADAITQPGQDETFLLSNMIPQVPENNRGIHESIESAVRTEAKRRGTLYVVTGPVFQGNTIKSLKDRVIIPTGIFKCLFDPARHESGCYLENNAPGTEYNTVSVKDVERLTGLNIFPGVADQTKNGVMQLPVAKLRKRGGFGE